MVGRAQGSSLNRRSVLHQLGGGALLAGLLLTRQVPEASAKRGHPRDTTSHPVIGAWMTNAVSTTAGITANLISFMPGGVVMHAASAFPQSTGMGVWAVEDDVTVVYSLIFRRQDKGTGLYIGSTRLNARVTLDPDWFFWSSAFGTALTNAAGEVTSTGKGNSRATRIVATPPPG